jgi:hypothetical protein
MTTADRTIARIVDETRYRLDQAARERATYDIDSVLLTMEYLIETGQTERAQALWREVKAERAS